uniref:Uncharacterized protein n=1 Tax=Arundo donax TaxID=35708 RepID=A0A0A9E2G5_ARUDO
MLLLTKKLVRLSPSGTCSSSAEPHHASLGGGGYPPCAPYPLGRDHLLPHGRPWQSQRSLLAWHWLAPRRSSNSGERNLHS